jgi:hypothetical protein
VWCGQMSNKKKTNGYGIAFFGVGVLFSLLLTTYIFASGIWLLVLVIITMFRFMFLLTCFMIPTLV